METNGVISFFKCDSDGKHPDHLPQHEANAVRENAFSFYNRHRIGTRDNLDANVVTLLLDHRCGIIHCSFPNGYFQILKKIDGDRFISQLVRFGSDTIRSIHAREQIAFCWK